GSGVLRPVSRKKVPSPRRPQNGAVPHLSPQFAKEFPDQRMEQGELRKARRRTPDHFAGRRENRNTIPGRTHGRKDARQGVRTAVGNCAFGQSYESTRGRVCHSRARSGVRGTQITPDRGGRREFLCRDRKAIGDDRRKSEGNSPPPASSISRTVKRRDRQ